MNWSDWFTYDENSPSCLRWKVERTSGRNGARVLVKAGDVAGSLTNYGYYSVRLKGKNHGAHRVIWEMFNCQIAAGMQIDHINGVRRDNRLANLRVVSNAENRRNMYIQRNTLSGINGVNRATNGRGYFYWKATWSCARSKSHAKYFSIAKHGEDEAFRLACEHRNKMIEQLNAEGAGYTDRHGQEKT